MAATVDAVVVGSGPNGLSAAVVLAAAGLSVVVYEGQETPGGGVRTGELTLPGFRHDLCSAVYPLAAASPLFRALPLEDYGVKWLHSPLSLAHPLGGSGAVALHNSVDQTVEQFPPKDRELYRRIFLPLIDQWESILAEFVGPLRIPQHFGLGVRFGTLALLPLTTLIKRFSSPEARALLAGLGAHSMLPLSRAFTSTFALLLGVLGHTHGWPIPQGGAGKITDALCAMLKQLGVNVICNHRIRSAEKLPTANLYLFDIGPLELAALGKDLLPKRYIAELRKYRYGCGVFKTDFALREPVPFKAEAARRAATIHLGGRADEIVKAEREVAEGKLPQNPFVLLAQPSVFDPSRSPWGHTLWAYTHVPPHSPARMTQRIISQIENVAPGFRECIAAQHETSPIDLERDNPNYVGGDINGGVQDFRQMFARPVSVVHPYRTPLKNWYLCSASTPPGGGVHGLCGYYAAKDALLRNFGIALKGEPDEALDMLGLRARLAASRSRQKSEPHKASSL